MTETNHKQEPGDPGHTIQTVMTPGEVLSPFRTLAERHLETCLSAWCDHHLSRLTDFQSRMQTCLDELARHAVSDDGLRAVWQETLSYFDGLQSWIDTLAYVNDTTTPDHIVTDWPDVSDTWIHSLPEQLNVAVTPEDLPNRPDDTFRIRNWKRVKRAAQFFSRASGKRFRTFSPRALSRYHLVSPFHEFLLSEWERYLELVARHLRKLHPVPHDFGLECLFLDDAEETWPRISPDRFTAQCAVWASYLAEFETAVAQIDDYRRTATERLTQWLDETGTQYRSRWCFAGTHILPTSAFGDGRSAKAAQRSAQRFEEMKQAWFELIKAERDDWRHEITLKKIQLRAGIAAYELRQSVQDVLTKQMIPACSTVMPPIADALDAVRAIDPADAAALEKTIKMEKRGLLRSVRREIMPQMMDTLLKADIDQHMLRLEQALNVPIQGLAETHRIIHRYHADLVPPVSEVEEVPIRALLEDRDQGRVLTALLTVRNDIRQDLSTTVQRLSEIDQVIDFNLDTALTQLKDETAVADAHQTVIEGLERAQNQVEQSINGYNELGQIIDRRVFESMRTYMSDVQTLLDTDAVLRLKLQLAQTQARERYRQYRRQVWTGVRRAIPWIMSLALGLGRLIYAQYRRMHRIAGLEAAPGTDLQQFLTDTRQQIDALPYVYQRVFHADTEADRRFFAGREHEMNTLRDDFQRWMQGYYTTTVVVGERGSGRTTLMQFAEQDIYEHHEIHRIDFQETVYTMDLFLPPIRQSLSFCTFDNLDELEVALQRLDTPHVCIVENIQNLFIKTVDGFDVLERFLLLISRTHRRVFWVLTCTLYSWEYLNKVIRIEQYFSRVLLLNRLSQDDMETIIMKRHRITGYQILFDIPDSVRQSRHFKKLRNEDEQQAHLKDLCFEQLQQVAMGNISVGMMFWLRGITVVENEHAVQINPLIDFDESSLMLLSSDEMFTLGTILHHETLSVEEHALVYHQSVGRSLPVLNILCNKGMLIEINGSYRVHPILYRPVVQALKRLNILH